MKRCAAVRSSLSDEEARCSAVTQSVETEAEVSISSAERVSSEWKLKW